MGGVRAATDDQREYLDALVAAGLLIPSGVPGLYGRGGAFEDVLVKVDAAITREAAADDAEQLRFPPLLPRNQLESIGYLKSFPHLAGSIFAFEGDELQAVEQEARAARH